MTACWLYNKTLKNHLQVYSLRFNLDQKLLFKVRPKNTSMN